LCFGLTTSATLTTYWAAAINAGMLQVVGDCPAAKPLVQTQTTAVGWLG